MPRLLPWLSRTSFCALLTITGCSDSDSRNLFKPGPPLAECPSGDYSRCDVRDEACQARLLELAACVRDTEAPSDLQIDVLTKADYVELLRDEAEDEDEPPVQHFSRALSLFGLAPRDGVPYDDQIEAQADFVAGQYRWAEKRVIVVDHGRPADSAEVNGVLFHELVHALQDAQHDLQTWPGEGKTGSFDASLAASTVVEGEASFYESRVSAPLLGLDYRQVDFESTFQKFMDRMMVSAFDSSLRLTQSYRTIPYGMGALQVFHAWDEGGPSGVEPLWADPPLTMQRVMAGLFDRNTPQASAVAIAAPDVPEGLTLYGDDALGAWGLCLVLTTREGVPSRVADFVDEALTWRGDRFSVYTDAEGSTFGLWQLELDSAPAARAMDDFFAKLSVDHGTAGSRVFVSFDRNDVGTSAALTAWGASWLASGSD